MDIRSGLTFQEFRALAAIPYGDGYTAFDAYAITLEDGDFLYALVRVTKPRLVVESGSGHGISGRFIAQALHDNRRGELLTYESNPPCAQIARDTLRGLPATVIEGDCRSCAGKPDLVYIDSHAERRRDDIRYWLTQTTALVCVHDATRDYPEFTLAPGVLLPGTEGLWLGRGG